MKISTLIRESAKSFACNPGHFSFVKNRNNSPTVVKCNKQFPAKSIFINLFVLLGMIALTPLAHAQVTQPTAWTAIYNVASGTASGNTFAVAAGSNRILIVGIAASLDGSGTIADPTTITYGGVTLTKAVGDGQNGRAHTWLYYLKDNAVMDNTTRPLNVTLGSSGSDNILNMSVFYTVFAGVDQAPATYTTGNGFSNSSSTNAAQLSAAMAVNTNAQAAYVSCIYNSNNTTVPNYTINANWTSGASNTGTSGGGNNVAWKNEVAKRAIPGSNVTDNAATSTISVTSRYSISAISLPRAPVVYTSIGSGDWNTPGIWDLGSVPAAGSNVVISGGNNVTISGATNTISSITVNGTLDVGSNTLNGTGVNNVSATGTLLVGGTNNFPTGFTTTTLSPGSTVNYNTGIQTVSNQNYSNLTLSGSGAKTLQTGTVTGTLSLTGTATATTAVAINIGNLNIGDGTTFTAAGFNLTVSGTTTVGGGASGNLTISSATGTKIFTGLVTINTGGTWTNTTANSTVTFRGGITNNGTFNAGTGVHTFDTNAQQLTGIFSIPNVTVTGITLTNNNTLTVGTALSGTGGVTQATNSTLNIGGTSAISTLTATNSGNTVNYTGTAQSVHSNNYVNLTLAGSGAKTLQNGTTSITGNLSLTGSATTTTVVGLNIGGNLSIGDGTTFTAAGFALTVTGTTSVGAGASGNLTISSATGTKIFTGLVTINTGGVWNNSGNSPVTFRGGITNNGNFTAGTGVHTFDTNAQALSGNTFTIPSVTITGITLTNNNTLTVNTALSGTGTLLQAAGVTLNIGAASALANINAIANGNTVNYTATAGTQTLIGGTYFNVNLNNTSGTNTANGNVSVTGAMVANGGAGGTLNMSTFTLAGTTITNNGTISTQNTSSTPIPAGQTWGGTINYNATAGSQTVVTGTYTNLTSGNTSGINSAAGDLIINGALTTTALGTLSLGTNIISGTLATITNNGTISTANTTATPLPSGLTWGGTINYNALTGGQTIVTGTYNNLTLGNTSGSSSPAGNLVVNGILTTTAGGTLNLTTNTLTGTLSSVVNNGTITTANTGPAPVPSGKTWGGIFIYAGSSAQTLVAGTYSNLNISNTTGVALGGGVSVNTSLNLSSSLTLNANNLTLGFTGAVTGVSSSIYIVTNNTGQLKRTIGGTPVSFPVGNSAYNPIIITNTGTSDVYGINVLDGTVTTAIDPSLAVDRRWQITEAVAGGSNLAIVAQYNSGEATADFSTGNPVIGFYNGTAWVKSTATYSGGSSPFTFTSLINLVPGNLTTGTQYLAVGKDYAFVAGPTQFAITSIVPNPAISGSGFQVTIESQNASNEASNVITQTFFNLSTNGNAGPLSGTTAGSIPAGQSSVTLNGVILSVLGTGATLTATLDGTNGGDALTPGTSAPFNVVASNASDIITAGNETPNIDYNSKTGAVINTTSDGIRVWSFSVRDGGSSADADNLTTILNNVTISKGASNTVTSWANTIQEAALFDGTTKVAEITVSGETLVFTGINGGTGVSAADNGTKTLDLYLTFKTGVITDGQRFQFAITNAGATAGAAGSLFGSFATANSSVTGTNNRIQVIATKLIFGAQALTDVAAGSAMTPPFTIRGVDVNNNLDIDYTSTITLSVTGSTFSGAAPSPAAIAGIATFSPVFSTTGTGVTVTGSDGVITATPSSNTFNVTNGVPVTTDLFRSKTSGNWDQVTTWQESHDGSSWFDAGTTPTNANSSSITIQNTHVVTVATSVTIDQTTVNAGGGITVNSGQRLDVADGAGTDLSINATGNVTVAGFLRLANNATITSTTTSLAFNSGGTYEHNYTTSAGIIPAATWNTGSTCSVLGYTTNTNAPTGLGQTFYNFTWNCTGQGTNSINLNSTLTTIQGDFNVLSTGTTGTIALMSNTAFTINIGGNLTVGSGANPATLDWMTGSSVPTMNLGGNLTIGSAGVITRSGSSVTPVLNFNKASGIQTYSSANAAGVSGGRFAATVGTGTSTNTLQLLSDLAMNGNAQTSFTVASNATLDCGTRIMTGAGATFNLNSGASIITAHAQGLSTSSGSGSIQVTGTKTYNATANFTYNGTAAQITGTALTTANNVTINNTAGVTLTSAATINGTLTLTNGLFIIGTNSLTIGASGTISGASLTTYVQTNNTGFLRRTVAASPVTFPVGSSSYNPITLTNSGTSDIYGITAIDGTVPNALDATFTVNRRWRINEINSGGSNLAVVGQYNSGEGGTNFSSGLLPKIGFYNGTVWVENAATQAGTNPFTFTSNTNFTPTDLTTGTQYFALGKDQAFTPLPQGTLTANSICGSGTGQLTFTATSGTSPLTIVYNDGTGNVTQNNVTSGIAFNVTPNPTISTTYTLVSVTDNDGDVRNSGFTGGTATINVNPAIADNTIGASQSICSGTTPAPMTGSVPTGGSGIYSFLWQSSTTSATTGFANAAGTNTGQNYTPPANITQTTWYRRVVTSSGCIDNSTAIQVTVNPAPTITPGPTLTAGQSCSPAAITLTGATFSAPATSAAWSIVSGGGTLSTTALTASPATVTYTPASNFIGTVTLALTTDACPTLSANRTINVTLPTLVNYDFNTGSSFATLTSNAVPNITSTAGGTSFATGTGTVTGGNAFTQNITAGNSLSQTATANNNWTFTLTGADVKFYKTFKLYFLGQRSGGTPQNINVLYSIDGGANFIALGNQPLSNNLSWVESSWTLPVAADNPTSLAIKLNNTSGTGTMMIDNVQIQGVYTLPADKTPVAQASSICEGAATNIQIPASQVGVNYQLRNNTGNVNIGSPVAGTGSTINLPTGNLTTSTTFNVLASNSCSVQMVNTATVNITAFATLSSSLTPPDICTNTTFSYIPTSATSGATFNWSRATVAGISNSTATGTGNPNETLINTTTTPKSVTYAYTVTANGCTNPTAFNVVVVVNPSPALSSTLTPAAVCDGNPFQYIPTSATPGAIFNWSRAAVAGISNAPASGTDNPNETLFNTTPDPVSVTYQYTLSANGCANPTAYNVVVVVEPSPSVVATDTTVSNSTGICGASITLGSNVTTNGTLTFYVDGNPITLPHTFPTGTTNVMVIAENNCGTSTTFFDVTVNDTETPVVPTLANVTGECSATATAPTTTDNCGGTITGTTTDPLTYSTQGTFVIHWSFDDGNGNISTTTQNVIVLDVTPPAVPVLNNVTGECSATATAPVATDACVGPITGTTSDALTYTTQGTHVIHWSFDDGRGNISTANQNVIISDVTPPAVPTLANVTGECTATATAPTTTDNCSGTITGTTTDALTYSTQGTHVIHWSFNDGNGNISNANQNVVIEDITPPAVPVLTNLTDECSVTATAPTTTDNCSGTITGTTTDPLTYTTQGTHVIHWSFNDGNGNISTANQNVIITDVTPPAVPVLSNVTGECSATATAPTTTDNCSGTITGTTTDPLTYTTQGTHVIHWSFDDGNGNISTANQNVVISDVTPPAVPTLANVTGECSATATAPTTTDNCAGTITGTTTDPLTYNTQGTHTIHWTFDDGNGNTSTATQNVVIDDVTPPATPTLANVTGECSATATAPTTTDNCSGTITGTTEDPLTYTTQGTHVIHWTFDDGNGNTSTATQNVVIDDVTPPATPTLTNITAECSATATAPTTTDNCSGTITGTTIDPLTYNTQGTHTIHWSFDDGNGNTSTATQNVIIDDVTPPAIPTLTNITAECSTTVTAPTTTDNCSGTVTGTTTDPLTYNTQGTHVIHWTFDDGNGNISTANQSVIITDNTPPAVPVLANVTGECSATATAPTTTDNCSGTITGTTTDPLTYTTQGTHVIHWSFDDGNGNISTANQNVVISDVTPPAVPTLANVTGECSATATAPTTTDNCTGTVTGTTTDPLTYTTQGTHVIHWSFDDGNGNISTANQNVIINDVTPPAVPVLANVTGECSATATAPTTTDNCTGTVTGTTTDPLTYTTQGTHVIHWSFDDGRGNISTATQNVVIDDITPPAVPVLTNITGECTATATAPTTTDNCAGTITGTTTDPLTYTSGTHVIHWSFDDGNGNISTANQNVIINDVTPPAVPVLTNITAECSVTVTAPTTTDNCAGTVTGTTTDPLTYSTQGTHIIHWSFDDGSGNISTANQNVIITDNTPPAVPVLANVTGECSATATAPTTTDNCAGTVTGTTTDPLTYSTQGTFVIHWSFNDGHGNTSTANQNVVINDVTPPAVPVLANVTGECSATAIAPTTTDNCSGTITGTTTDPLTYTSGTHVIHWSFNDGHGNISTANQNVIIQDVTGPTVTTAANSLNATLECDDADGLNQKLELEPTATDNCGGIPVIHLLTDVTTQDPLCPNGFTRVRTWNFTDANNNPSANFVQTIIVRDITPPFVVQMPGDVTVDADANCQATGVNLGILSAQDNCSPTVTITNDHPSIYPIGNTIVTWTIKDDCNNTITRQQTVRVLDHTNPVIANCPVDITVFTGPGALTCTKGVSWTPPSASDNCSVINSFTSNYNPGDVFPAGTTLVTYTAIDASTNSSTCSFNVNVVDNTPPVINNCPANIVTCNPNITWTAPTATDNCGVTTFNNNAPASFPVGVTTVTYTAKDAANNTTICSFTVTVNPSPNAVAASNSPICSGNTLSLSAAGGTAYAWTGPNGFSSSLQNPSIGLATTAATGTYTVVVSNSFGCSATATTNVVVNANATAGAGSNSPVCTGGTLNLSASGGVSYSWTGPNGFVSLQQNPTIVNVTNNASGIYSVTVTNAAGCTAQAFTSVSVGAANAFAANNGPLCEGATLSLSAAGGVSYAWTGPNSFSSTQQNPAIPNATTAAGGSYTVTVTGSGGCTATATTNVTVSAVPTALAANNGPVCQGGTLSLSSAGGSSYAWTGPNGFSSLQQNPVIFNISSAGAGFYTVTVSNAAGCSSTANTQVTVNAGAPATAASNSPVCTGSTLNLFASAGASYSWTGPNGFSSIQQTPTLSNVTNAASGIYTVTVTNASGCASTASTSVAVNQLPVASASANGPLCEGATLSLSASGGTSYSWTGPNGFNSTQQNPSLPAVTTAATGIYTVTVSNAANCSAQTTVFVQVNAAPVASASSNSPVCAGATLNLLGGGGATYSWTGPNGFSSTQQNPTIINATAAAGGLYTLTVTNAAGCTSTTTTNVTMNGGVIASASSNSPVCAGATLNLSAGGGVSYSWNGPNGFNSTQQNPTIANVTAAAVGTYTVIVTGSGGCTTSTTTSVAVNAASVGGSISGSTSACSGSNSGTLNLTGHTGNVMRWESSTDGGGSWTTITNTTTSLTYNNLTQTTQYQAIVQNATCTSATSAMATITVNNSAVGGTVSGSTAVCNGSNSGAVNLSGQSGAITKWQFSTDGGGSWTDIANTTTSQAYNNLTQTTMYHAVISGCTTVNSSNATITVTNGTVGGSVSGTTSVCSGSNSGTMNLTGHTGNVIRWESSIDNGGTWSTISNTTTSQSYSNLTQTTQYRAVVQSGTCTSANSAAATITISASAVGGTVSGSTTVCTGNNSGTVTLSGQAGTITKWQFSTDGGGSWTDIANTTTSQSYSNLTQPTQYRAVITGCTTVNSSAATITVTPASVGGTVSGSNTVCSGSNSGTMVLSGHTGNVIRWEFSTDNGGTWSTISNTTTSQTYTNLTQSRQYRAVVLSGVCASANSAAAIITVGGSAVGGTISGSTSVCSGNNNGTLTLSGHSGTITMWQFSTNGGGSWTNIANTTTAQTYTNLTQTTQYRAVISGCATTVNSGTATVTVGGSLAVTIAASDAANEFCNNLTLTANASLPVQSYLWSNSATTQSIKLGGANAAGNYTVTVTAVGGCTGTATYNYAPQAVASNYTLLGLQTVTLAAANTVQNGSVGNTLSNGTITIGNTTSVAGPGAFVKAQNLTISASANVPVRINAPAVVTLPTMQFNTTNTNALGNVSIANNTNGTVNGNFRNLTIGTNCNVTLTGTIFRLIAVGAGSTIRFTQPVINVGGINLSQGSIASPTTVAFSQATVVKSNADINVATLCNINPDNYKVVFYIGVSSGNSSPDFNVATGGNVTVNASIYVPNGDISVGGNNTNNTFMNGKFIASLVRSTGQRVIWNSFNCATANLITRTTQGNSSSATIIPIPESEQAFMTATVTPVPTESFFTLRIKSNSEETVQIKIYDIVGRQIEQLHGSPDQPYRFGSGYMQGSYIVEVHQGSRVRIMQVVKL